MKPIRLQVQMPTIGLYTIRGRSAVGEVEQLTETMVIALRRVEFQGALDEGVVRALAFVPEVFRPNLRQKGRLIDGEYTWCTAWLAENKKSLAPFMASGDREWKKEADLMKVADLFGGELDFWVARARGVAVELKHGVAIVERVRVGMLDGEPDPIHTFVAHGAYRPSTDWQDAGALIERERIGVEFHRGEWGAWLSSSCYESNSPDASGPTPLIAACRAIVREKFGDEVPA